jgi:hypothetical protein
MGLQLTVSGGPGAGELHREHLLDRLSCDSELASDVGLGDAVGKQLLHQRAALVSERPGLTSELDGLSTDFLDLSKRLAMCCSLVFHAASVTTPGCRVNLGLSVQQFRWFVLEADQPLSEGSMCHQAVYESTDERCMHGG